MGFDVLASRYYLVGCLLILVHCEGRARKTVHASGPPISRFVTIQKITHSMEVSKTALRAWSEVVGTGK